MDISVVTPELRIGCLVGGPPDGRPIILLHGWPDDALTWTRVVPSLHAARWRTILPYLRGCGPTRFRDSATRRSGQLTALAADLVALVDALEIERFAVVGHDWGARAAYIAAALWPARVTHLVALSVGWGTNDPQQSMSLQQVQNYWYHWYMALPRGKALVETERLEYARYIWDIWSPHWKIPALDFETTARSFENPDWADVVIHSYRHRWGYAEGDPKYATLEQRLSPVPTISAPTLVLHGADDPCNSPASSENKEQFFSGHYQRTLLPRVGHFPQREAPDRVAKEILTWLARVA